MSARTILTFWKAAFRCRNISSLTLARKHEHVPVGWTCCRPSRNTGNHTLTTARWHAACGSKLNLYPSVQASEGAMFHTSCPHRGLEEFFDDPKTYGELEVKSGRPWSLDELRLKDNPTLHKLWYVLLKEKNMLLTMQAEAESQDKMMPGADRISKVNKSMSNIQQVIKERTEALNELQLGRAEEWPSRLVYTPFGYKRHIRPREHYFPMFANKRYHRKRFFYRPFVKKYMGQWLEQEDRKQQQGKRRRSNIITKLRKRYPDADVWEE